MLMLSNSLFSNLGAHLRKNPENTDWAMRADFRAKEVEATIIDPGLALRIMLFSFFITQEEIR